MRDDLGPGSLLGPYRIESLVGRGGMGVVYLAEHVTLGQRRALKVVAPELVSDEAFRDRFLREARLAASLEHPNIIPVYDAGDQDGVLYLAMRFVEGENLGHLLTREGRPSVERTLQILGKAAGALDEAHRNGLVHRDVKPDNILLGFDGSVFLTDFGLVRRLDSQTRLTKTGSMMGTLSYMAPEVFRGQEIDARTDVYSLTCVLFECLTGGPPFANELQPAVISAHLMDPPPSVTAARPEMPMGIDAVVARGMAKERTERFPSCGALIDAAAETLGRPGRIPMVPPTLAALPPAAPPGGPEEHRELPAVPPPPPESRTGEGDGRSSGPRRGRLAAAIVAVVALAGLAVVIVPRLGEDEAGPSGETSPETTTAPTSPTGPTGTGPSGTRGVEVVAAVEGTPAAIDLGGGAIWVGSDDGSRGRLSRIDAESGVVDAVDVGRGPVRITFTGTPGGSDDSVWTANQLDDSVSRVDLGLDGAVERIPAGAGPVRILSPAGTRFVWVANGDGATLTRIDLDTGVVTDIPVGEGPQSLSSDSGSVWTANAGDGTVSRVDVGDPVDVTPIRVGTSLSSILRAQPYVWVADAGGDVVVPIDPNGDTPLPPIPVGSDPEGLTNDGLGSMWVRSATGTTVTRIDMASLTAAEPIDLGGHPVAMAVTPGVVWVGIDDGSVARIDVESGALRSVPIGCTPVAMTSEREPSAVAMPLRGVWVACEDGAILRIGPGV